MMLRGSTKSRCRLRNIAYSVLTLLRNQDSDEGSRRFILLNRYIPGGIVTSVCDRVSLGVNDGMATGHWPSGTSRVSGLAFFGSSPNPLALLLIP